jgi:thymidine phosphorylase
MLRARIGDRVERGQPLAEIHARAPAAADAAVHALRAAYVLSPEPVAAAADAYEVIGKEQLGG